MESWVAGNTGLSAVSSIYRSSVFSDANGGAAPWMHWRKSNTGKQLLGFMRAVIEGMEADPMSAGPTPALQLANHTAMLAALHGCIHLLAVLFEATHSAALWPAMREWMTDQGGIKCLWSALARCMVLAAHESPAVMAAICGANSPLSEMRKTLSHSALGATLVSALSMTSHLTSGSGPDELSLLPGLVTSLFVLFGVVLPRELAAGYAPEWDVFSLLRHIVRLRIQSRSVGRIPPCICSVISHNAQWGERGWVMYCTYVGCSLCAWGCLPLCSVSDRCLTAGG